jgi:hypothetical protein
MIRPSAYGILGATIILCIFLSGCTAPPAGQQVTPPVSSFPTPVISSGTTAPVMYVTMATPFAQSTPVNKAVTYDTLPPLTQNPKDMSCRILSKTQTYADNGTAFTFNLKNPPMYIVYSVIPTNITEYHMVSPGNKTNPDVVFAVDTYNPASQFVITVRNKTTGEVYLQDGFGTEYSDYLTRTLTVLDTDDLLIEMNGNLITATASFWVKPAQNFDSPGQANATVCAYIDQTRSIIDYPTETPTPTWTL